jgi:hypothetical protein
MALGTWEGVGQITGTWLGAVMWIASAPVVAVDGPLPIADVAWVAANIRNTNYLRKKGGLIGAELDDVLAEGTGSAPGESWGAGYDTPEVSNKKDTPYVFNKLPGGSGFKMDFEFSFDNWVIPPMDYQPLSVVAPIEEPTPMKLTYVERDSRWPFWN